MPVFTATGLILSAAFILTQPLLIQGSMQIQNMLIITITFLVIAFTKIPSPLVVLAAILLGFIF